MLIYLLYPFLLIHIIEQCTGEPWKPLEHPVEEPEEVAGKERRHHVGSPAVGQEVRQQCQQGNDEQTYVAAAIHGMDSGRHS